MQMNEHDFKKDGWLLMGDKRCRITHVWPGSIKLDSGQILSIPVARQFQYDGPGGSVSALPREKVASMGRLF